MADKTAAAFHGIPCNGACDKNPFGTCSHGRACQFHLREDAARIKYEVEQSAIIEFRKQWM